MESGCDTTIISWLAGWLAGLLVGHLIGIGFSYFMLKGNRPVMGWLPLFVWLAGWHAGMLSHPAVSDIMTV